MDFCGWFVVFRLVCVDLLDFGVCRLVGVLRKGLDKRGGEERGGREMRFDC